METSKNHNPIRAFLSSMITPLLVIAFMLVFMFSTGMVTWIPDADFSIAEAIVKTFVAGFVAFISYNNVYLKRAKKK